MNEKMTKGFILKITFNIFQSILKEKVINIKKGYRGLACKENESITVMSAKGMRGIEII